jgi:membrane protease YdiL (CAAX protease family)
VGEPSPHARKAPIGLILIIALLLVTLAASMYKGQPIYIFGYIMTLVYAISRVTRHHRPLQELGVKTGFAKDFKRIWYYFGVDAVLFQLLPPTLGIAFVFGYYPELINHITGRLSINFGSLQGLSAIGGLLAAALILTLIEEVVFRVTVQERLSWFIGTPAAIFLVSIMFGFFHIVGTSGSLLVILTDVAGVAIDGAFFGVIYAKTRNLAVTWTTHFTADVVGLLALAFIF